MAGSLILLKQTTSSKELNFKPHNLEGTQPLLDSLTNGTRKTIMRNRLQVSGVEITVVRYQMRVFLASIMLCEYLIVGRAGSTSHSGAEIDRWCTV